MPDENNRVPKTDDSIEELNERLSAREAEDFTLHRTRLSPRFKGGRPTWEQVPLVRPTPRKSTTLLSKLLVVSAGFFVVVLLVATYILFSGANIVSNNNIETVVRGPLYVKAGDQIDLQVLLANKNKEPIKAVTLKVEFPSGTRSPEDISKDFLRSSVFFGDIASGETVNKSVKAFVFGQENSDQEIKLTVEYSIPGSNAIFRKALAYKYKINASPINLSLDVPSEVNVNQEVTVNIKVDANSATALKNLLLQVNYPPGFQFKSSNIKPTFDNNKWAIGDLAIGSGQNFVITGILAGQSEDIKSFEALTGVVDENNEEKISVIYNDTFKTLTIKKAFLGITALINEQDLDQYIVGGSEALNTKIRWANNLDQSVSNVSISVALSGEALDRNSVSVKEGFYRSQDNKVIFTQNDDPSLANLAPGADGEFSFSFHLLSLIAGDGRTIRSPQVNLTATITGTRAGGEQIHNEITKVIKIQSPVRLSALSSYSSGPFTNYGPMPPKADTETAYTVTWTLINPSNNLKSVRVRADLPAGVKWLGNFSPNDEGLEYDTVRNEVVWKIDYLPAGTGLSTTAKQVSFQLGLTPSVSQVGEPAPLLSVTNLTAFDTYTNTTLTQMATELSTKLNNDSLSGVRYDTVVP